MTIESTAIEGVYVVNPDVHEDTRGFFMETFREDEFAKAGITEHFVQDNHSRSTQRNVLRGLHFQWDRPMAKLMRVTRGSAFLVAVDLRKGSPTLGSWFGIEASEDNKKELYAPASFARGFQTLSDECEVQYKCSALYNPDTQGEILWNDPEIAITWPLEGEPLMSERSAHAPSLSDWLSRPESNSFTL
ncbi:dTDP-4-dehydrorhamnose 3,5-epimerase [Patescibacteria group bacterium]|nr:dTDP-4-dehydrorhamnose 3,5-epimerase [Patescibacteria group bacterium]